MAIQGLDRGLVKVGWGYIRDYKGYYRVRQGT